MKKPVKQYNGMDLELQETNVKAEEAFYMCEFVDLRGARPEKQEIEELEKLANQN